jgi:hypothetical protein
MVNIVHYFLKNSLSYFPRGEGLAGAHSGCRQADLVAGSDRE